MIPTCGENVLSRQMFASSRSQLQSGNMAPRRQSIGHTWFHVGFLEGLCRRTNKSRYWQGLRDTVHIQELMFFHLVEVHPLTRIDTKAPSYKVFGFFTDRSQLWKGVLAAFNFTIGVFYFSAFERWPTKQHCVQYYSY